MSTPAERVNETKKDNAFSREGGVLVTQSANELISGHENTNLPDLQADITLRIATVQDIDCLQYIEKTCFTTDRLSKSRFKFYINANHTWLSASGGYWNAHAYSGGNDAYYDDIRITKGHARYTAADETANIPTEAYKTGDVSTTTFTADGNIYYDDGKVGIGTTAPAHTLDVRGTSNHTQLFQNGEAVMTRDDIPNQYWFPYDETFGTGDGTEGDENYDKVSLLLHMNGSDSSTEFDDHSQWNHTVAQAAATPEGGTQPTVKIVDGEPASTTLTAHSLDTGLLHYWKMEDDWTDSKGDKTFSTNGTMRITESVL